MQLDSLKEEQIRLSGKILIEPLSTKVEYIGGCDVSYSRERDRMAAVFTVFSLSEIKLIEWVHSIGRVEFPYIPTFLSFRELPLLMEAFKKLKKKPDLILVDGQGILHPRKLGLASHLGLVLDIPTIGCAKSSLVGEFSLPGMKRGEWTPVYVDGEIRGVCLRTRDKVKPLFVSPGHRVSIEDSIRYVLKTSLKFRLPEPIRWADHLSRKVIKNKREVSDGI
jgi:deoxyribonuclease V